jgi:hypothetical protein
MIFEEQKDALNAADCSKLSIKSERKICKDLSDLGQYFKNIKSANGKLNFTAFNEQTRTLIAMNIT